MQQDVIAECKHNACEWRGFGSGAEWPPSPLSVRGAGDGAVLDVRGAAPRRHCPAARGPVAHAQHRHIRCRMPVLSHGKRAFIWTSCVFTCVPVSGHGGGERYTYSVEGGGDLTPFVS